MLEVNDFYLRRKALADKLPNHSIAVISAHSVKVRSHDTHFAFRQHNDFYYLTGLKEPDAQVIIEKQQHGHVNCTLFLKKISAHIEQWEGGGLSLDDACSFHRFDDAYSLDEFSVRLVDCMRDKIYLFYDFDKHLHFNEYFHHGFASLKKQARQGHTCPQTLKDLNPLLSEMRVIKSDKEIALMRHAADISVLAHRQTMQKCPSLEYEYQLEAELYYVLGQHGIRHMAYEPIVASGVNACTLHYIKNTAAIDKNALMLIDAGGEHEYYAADITRTYPANGRFTSHQKDIYELVLAAQKAAIAAVKPGCRYDRLQTIITEMLTQGLLDLGILKGHYQTLLEQCAYKPYYMHSSGHWLGLDVHDCGSYQLNQQWRTLEPGMVLTIEPGLYFHPQFTKNDHPYHGIGVRIEDDILVTDSGYENLTGDLEVEAADIEQSMRG